MDGKKQEGQGIPINGVAHVFLTVSKWDESVAWYKALCGFFRMQCVLDKEGWLYYIGGRTAIGIAAADTKYATEQFQQFRVGLHHVCFRARKREDVDKLHRFLRDVVLPAHGGKIVSAPKEGPFAPGYYSVLFEDPNGIRLELNYVPGKGWLGVKGAQVGGYTPRRATTSKL